MLLTLTNHKQVSMAATVAKTPQLPQAFWSFIAETPPCSTQLHSSGAEPAEIISSISWSAVSNIISSFRSASDRPGVIWVENSSGERSDHWLIFFLQETLPSSYSWLCLTTSLKFSRKISRLLFISSLLSYFLWNFRRKSSKLSEARETPTRARIRESGLN